MKRMRDVWLLTIAGGVLGLGMWLSFWAASGADLKRGAWGNFGRGIWQMAHDLPSWLPPVACALLGAGIVYGIGKSSYSARQFREAHAPVESTAPHPMD